VLEEELISGIDLSNGMDEEMNEEIDYDDPAWLQRCRDTAHAEQIKQEAIVREAATSLRSKIQTNPRVPLGEISGKWTLYSSQYLEIYANKPQAEADVEHWDVGTLRIGEEYMDEWARDGDADVGIEVDFIDGEEEYNITPNTPGFASNKSITRTARGSEKVFSCDITFLGNDLLQMGIHGHVLAGKGGSEVPELYFVGVLNKDFAQLERDARRMSSDEADE
jgi:hypothetical protein